MGLTSSAFSRTEQTVYSEYFGAPSARVALSLAAAQLSLTICSHGHLLAREKPGALVMTSCLLAAPIAIAKGHDRDAQVACTRTWAALLEDAERENTVFKFEESP